MKYLHWRKQGEFIKDGISVQWVGGLLIHIMPRHRRWRWKVRVHIYNRQPFRLLWDVWGERVVNTASTGG